MTSFLFRPSFLKGESLTSYIHRIAYANSVSTHELWRLLLAKDAHYPQSSMSSILDLYPLAAIKLNKLESMLGIEIGLLKTLTFMTVFHKLGIKENDMPRSRVLSNLIETKRKYCPICLSGTFSYKLIWQVKEITWCDEHNIQLHSRCWKCGKDIPLLPSEGVVGLCPYCLGMLNDAPITKLDLTDFKHRVQEDWMFLLTSDSIALNLIDDLTIEQNLALRTLYEAQKNSEQEGRDFGAFLNPILQLARNSKKTQTSQHLSSILYILRASNISFKNFLKLKLPIDFVESVLKPNIRLVDQYTCLAPWCESYLETGTLKRTTTSTKKRHDGNTYNYYMYCSKCGLEYCLNKEKKLIERGSFISFAWEKVRPRIDNSETLRQLAQALGATVDKTRRAIVFLAANNLTKIQKLPIEVPNTPDADLISAIVDLINLGLPAKQIRKKLGLTYNQFLYHWFIPDVQISYLNRKKTGISKCTGSLKRRESFESAIDYFLRNNKTITLQSISNFLDICPETLRLWGFLPELKEAKQKQQKTRYKQYEFSTQQAAENIINELLMNSEPVTSEEVYKRIGRSRTSIVRSHPQVTQYITQLIINAKNGSFLTK